MNDDLQGMSDDSQGMNDDLQGNRFNYMDVSSVGYEESSHTQERWSVCFQFQGMNDDFER